MLILRNTCKQLLDPVAAEIRQAVESVMVDNVESRGPARFSDLFSESMVFPIDAYRSRTGRDAHAERLRELF